MSEIHGIKRVLFVGQEPETVDFSDPALPPGFDAAKIHAGISVAMQQMAAHGWRADLCPALIGLLGLPQLWRT